MNSIMTIGSVLVDVFITSQHFSMAEHDGQTWLCQAYGQKNELDSLAVHTGGGAGNTAVAFQRLGFPTSVVAELGTDGFAQVVEQDLVKSQVETKYLIRERKEQTGGSVIMVGADGGRTVMVHRGAAAQLNVEDLPRTQMAKQQWIHVSSIGGHADVLKAIFATVRQETVGLSWNPGQAELELLLELGPAGLGLACDILVLNLEEWAKIQSIQTQLQTAIPLIVVTNGKAGGQVLQRWHDSLTYTAPEVASADDTGAGDAFAATFVAARLLEQPVPVAIQWAVTNAAAVVQKVGAKPGLLSRPELEKMVPESHL